VHERGILCQPREPSGTSSIKEEDGEFHDVLQDNAIVKLKCIAVLGQGSSEAGFDELHYIVLLA
jgi:hypothetical protein